MVHLKGVADTPEGHSTCKKVLKLHAFLHRRHASMVREIAENKFKMSPRCIAKMKMCKSFSSGFPNSKNYFSQ